MDPVEEKNMPATEEATAELFDDIDVAYFMEDGFDAPAYELQKMLGIEFEIDELERERFKLKRQLQVVSKKVSSLIMKNSIGFSSQVKHYSLIQQEADGIVQIIGGIRSILNENRRQCCTALNIVGNYRKRKYLCHLKSVLKTIKTLYETEFRLKELIAECDFPIAIQICVEAINAAERFKHFDCIRDLSENLAKTLESMESHIDDALAAMTIVFDVDRYSLINSAYQMLGKLENAARKLQSFFRATIESSARSMVVEILKRVGTNSQAEIDSMSYEQLCEAIPDQSEHVLFSIGEIGRVLFKILCIYHSLLRYHVEEDERLLMATQPSTSIIETDTTPIIEKGIFQKSLIDNLYGIFKCAANKYNTMLCCHDLAALKFDHFIEVVEMANRFRKFGRKHFGNSGAELALTIEKQTNQYFSRYHSERMDELKMFLENEAFALCPVSVQFTLFDLPEFHFLKNSMDSFDDEDCRVHQISSVEELGLGDALDFVLISMEYMAIKEPFISESSFLFVNNDKIKIVADSRNSSSMERSSSDESSYSKGNNEESLQNSMPNLCNTALNLLRFFGKYIRMTTILRSIADQAMLSIIQHYKYFLYTIYSFFCTDLEPIPQVEIEFSSLRLRNLIESIRRSILMNSSSHTTTINGTNSATALNALDDGKNDLIKKNISFINCKPSGCIQKSDPKALFSLAERIVAVESVIFLSKQLELLRPVLQSLVSKTNKPCRVLDEFYKNILPVTIDLRWSAYGCVATRVLNYPQFIKQVIQANWDVGDLQSQHSVYVDSIISEASNFDNRFSEQVHEMAHVTSELKSVIWSTILYCLFRTLVQGYSEASKKCSNEGRALMLLDFELLGRELEAISTLKPLPHKAFLENYIKAFYLPQENLDEWIVHHTEYSVGQVTALMNAASAVSGPRKSKFSFMTMLENNKDLLS